VDELAPHRPEIARVAPHPQVIHAKLDLQVATHTAAVDAKPQVGLPVYWMPFHIRQHLLLQFGQLFSRSAVSDVKHFKDGDGSRSRNVGDGLWYQVRVRNNNFHAGVHNKRCGRDCDTRNNWLTTVPRGTTFWNQQHECEDTGDVRHDHPVFLVGFLNNAHIANLCQRQYTYGRILALAKDNKCLSPTSNGEYSTMKMMHWTNMETEPPMANAVATPIAPYSSKTETVTPQENLATTLVTPRAYDWSQNSQRIDGKHNHPYDDANDDVQNPHGYFVRTWHRFMASPAPSKRFPVVCHAFKPVLQLLFGDFTVAVEVNHLAKVPTKQKRHMFTPFTPQRPWMHCLATRAV
jgi:hypothetical protein